ncbi:MAG: DNA translocase FtsK [Cyanobacteria bacterium]|nr:DNA translocase FtsK [Cyanobacteriota bacterium]MDW8201346.1 DNA translocase FtsK [Cyanobacteriota bacterium SKYGB_h_bin112]
MNPSLSVTKVRVAFECPRLFYLGHHRGGSMLFQGDKTTIGLGKAFHTLSKQMVQAIRRDRSLVEALTPEPSQLQGETMAAALQSRLYSQVFFPYLQTAIQDDASKADLLYQLWQGLTRLLHNWAKLLVVNRHYCTPTEVVEKTFLAEEMAVSYRFKLPDRSEQLVNGQFDCLVYDFHRHRLCMVEYKTYPAIDPTAQLIQVALYSYMLRQKIGLPIDSTVYNVLPDWQEYAFSWDELEATIYQLLPHKLQQMQQWLAWQPSQPDPPPATALPQLCELCPQFTQCQSFFSKTSRVALPTVPPSPPPPSNSPAFPTAAEVGQQLVATLRSFGIETTYQGAAMGPAFMRIKLKPMAGVKVSSIVRLSDDLQVQMGLTMPPLIAPEAGYVSVDLPRADRQVAQFEDYIRPQRRLPTDPVTIAIGIDLENRLIEADLSDPNTCHFLVGGTTGSGKSEFLRALILSLMGRYAPEHLNIALVDPKRVTFPEFAHSPWLYRPVVKDAEAAIALMADLVTEMEERYERFEQAHCADIRAYNQCSRTPLHRLVCVFDEYADFMAEKEIAKQLEHSIKRLGAMSRAAGIHLIIATQRPEAKVVTPLIRSNLPGRVALRTASTADSAIVLGGKQTAAANLLGKGDLLYLAGAKTQRLQSLLVRDVARWL